MARKVELSQEALSALGTEKLAALILSEAEVNPAFAKRIKAALVAGEGVAAVAALIDRRLASLERARSMVDREKEREFAADLETIIDTIVDELGARSPEIAVQRMLRFIDNHGRVFERIDDSGGSIQSVYWRGAGLIPSLVEKLPVAERAWLPERLSGSLAKDTHGLARDISASIVPLLPADALVAWDEALGVDQSADSVAIDVRQAIADARGDVDGYLRLESQKSAWRQNPLAVAERLRAAGRLEEALAWARRDKNGGLAVATEEDIADGRIRSLHDLEKVTLEARILEEMGEVDAAQALRWAAFETSLNADLLREYLRKIEDFSEYDEQERAFGVAMASPHIYAALRLFLAWPKLDRAAKLVLAKRDLWNGMNYGLLPGAAAELEHEFPAAATILYRALLDSILTRAKSQAYRHGAAYLARLTAMGARLPADSGIETHELYLEGLKKTHARKTGFWTLAAGALRHSA